MKKPVALILSVILILGLCSCGNQNESNSKPNEVESSVFDLSEYKETASAYRAETYQASIILSNMGNYENTYWKALGRLSDTMVDSAFEWLSENSEETQDTMAAANESISSAYKDLVLVDFGDDKEAAEIDAGIRSLYDGYSSLYTLVTEPTGSREDFVRELSQLIGDVGAANDDLLLFLPENE